MTQSLSSPPAPSAQVSPASPAGAPNASVTRQGSRFTLVGSAGTGLQLGLYAALSVFLGAQLASAASWLLSTVVTNRLHRAISFDVHGADRIRTDQLVAFLTSLFGLGITSIVLAGLSNAVGLAGLAAIVAVNTVVGAGRFFGLRWWLSGSGQAAVGRVTGALTTLRNSQGHCFSLHH